MKLGARVVFDVVYEGEGSEAELKEELLEKVEEAALRLLHDRSSKPKRRVLTQWLTVHTRTPGPNEDITDEKIAADEFVIKEIKLRDSSGTGFAHFYLEEMLARELAIKQASWPRILNAPTVCMLVKSSAARIDEMAHALIAAVNDKEDAEDE